LTKNSSSVIVTYGRTLCKAKGTKELFDIAKSNKDDLSEVSHFDDGGLLPA
jgi:hypothetical protein